MRLYLKKALIGEIIGSLFGLFFAKSLLVGIIKVILSINFFSKFSSFNIFQEIPVLITIHVIISSIVIPMIAISILSIGLMLAYYFWHPIFIVLALILIVFVVTIPSYFVIVLYSLKCKIEGMKNSGEIIYNPGEMTSLNAQTEAYNKEKY